MDADLKIYPTQPQGELSIERIERFKAIGRVLITILICGTMLMLFFRGEPDLVQGIVNFLSACS